MYINIEVLFLNLHHTIRNRKYIARNSKVKVNMWSKRSEARKIEAETWALPLQYHLGHLYIKVVRVCCSSFLKQSLNCWISIEEFISTAKSERKKCAPTAPIVCSSHFYLVIRCFLNSLSPKWTIGQADGLHWTPKLAKEVLWPEVRKLMHEIQPRLRPYLDRFRILHKYLTDIATAKVHESAANSSVLITVCFIFEFSVLHSETQEFNVQLFKLYVVGRERGGCVFKENKAQQRSVNTGGKIKTKTTVSSERNIKCSHHLTTFSSLFGTSSSNSRRLSSIQLLSFDDYFHTFVMHSILHLVRLRCRCCTTNPLQWKWLQD